MNPSEPDKIADLRKVLEISRSMAAATDVNQLLQVIIDRSMELLGAERASIFLYDPASNELISRIATGLKELRIPADRGIAGETVRSQKTINVSDAYADPRFNPETDRRTGFRTRNLLSVPLMGQDGILGGVLQVINKRNGVFDAYDVELAETLGAQAGVALRGAELIEAYLLKEQMERAMKIARDIQRGLLPRSNPTLAGFDIAGFMETADQTGGDMYDFQELSDGHWGIIVADASGHGIGPALVIAETRAMLRAVNRQGAGVGEVLTVVNRLLTQDMNESRFVTCFLGLLDGPNARMHFASAGHGPLVFYNRARDEFAQLPATSLPLGVLDDTEYEEVLEHLFAPGDFAVLTTDGFFEAKNPNGDEFGMNRMLEILRRGRDLPAEKMIAELHRAVLVFTAGLPQADDLTAVVVKKTQSM